MLEHIRFNGEDVRSFDTSIVGPGNNLYDNKDIEYTHGGVIQDPHNNSVQLVNKLNQDYFRKKLVENFYIKWQHDKVYWPRAANRT